MSEYYGCEIVKDEEAYNLEHLLTDKDNFLNFIKQLRKVTKSDEPLILLPTRTRGKSSSAKIGSCHWAVTKMIEQHLGKIFCGFSIIQSSTTIDDLDSILIDNKINCLDAAFHSAWLTPEEKAVNLINYVNQQLEENNKLKKIKDYLDFKHPNRFLFLPTNKHCYYKNTPQGEYTYNDVSFFYERKRSVLEYEIIKKIGTKIPIEILTDNMNIFQFGFLENEETKLLLNRIVMCKNFSKQAMTPSINNLSFIHKFFPNLTNTFFSNDFENNFRHFCKNLPTAEFDLILKELKKKYNQDNNSWLFNTSFDHPDRSPKNKKDLFSRPSLISKKYHYEQGNHPLFDDKIEYRTIDKKEVNSEILNIINNMSESQKNYETKRAEKKGITLEQYILKQKFKLSN